MDKKIKWGTWVIFLIIMLATSANGAEKKPISLELKNANIVDVLQMLAKEGDLSIVTGPDVTGNVTLSLSKADINEALEAIIKSGGFAYKKEGEVLRIYSPRGRKAKRFITKTKGIVAQSFAVDYVEPENLKQTLAILLPRGTKILTTKGSNIIVVEGGPTTVNKAYDIIREIDVPPQQVMVKAKIIEVKYGNLSSMGMNLSYTNPNNPNETIQTKGLASPATATGAAGLFYGITTANEEALLETLQTKTDFNVLSSPSVLAVTGQKAEIITGSRLGYKIKTITTTGLIESVEFLDVGTKLEITPYIKNDGYIVMDIHPEISEGSIVDGLPQKNSTETTTRLSVKDGQTIVIGGLIKNKAQEVNKGVPILSDIPLLGIPFRRTEIEIEKREILIFITPNIVTEEFLAEMNKPIETLEKKRQERQPTFFW